MMGLGKDNDKKIEPQKGESVERFKWEREDCWKFWMKLRERTRETRILYMS